ncbi:MAG TPA: PA domain-containing protein [Candidatus Krumholzibacteria bacterium]|nr:PA domain-containing protein [Candidatus Krumholzibacteria bacterium]
MRAIPTTKREQTRPRAGLALLVLASILVLMASVFPVAAATITIVNTDGLNEGFNDPTPAAPVGGNPGTTIGQQRLNVFTHAAGIWGGILPSSVTIRIQAAFNAQTCTATSAVLGSAGTIHVARDFPNAPFTGTWYHMALANKLAGVDLEPGVNDINATFNSNINGSPSCLGGRTWYYGFDGNEGTNIELLPVVLHEMGHGLGFSSITDEVTGAFLNGFRDIWSIFMFDTDVGLHWDQMTNQQRAASAVNSLGLVWDGPAVKTMAPILLGPRPQIVVNAPVSIAGTYFAGVASFGSPLTQGGLTGDVVLVADNTGVSSTDACEPVQNVVAGKIALIDRGNCTFTVKALNAQNAGAIGVIVADNVVASAPPSMGGSDPSVTIKVASLTQADGNTIKGQLGNGVNATLSLDPNLLAGANAQYQVFLYAPNPLESGSSVSHYDRSALPDLLMEPALSTALSSGVDLTRYHFEDIGWLPRTTDVADYGTRARFWGGAPNPFALATTVRFDLSRTERVDLVIYDVAGRLVRRLASGPMDPGSYTVLWDGTDDRGQTVAPGVYFSVFDGAGKRETQRLVRIR